MATKDRTSLKNDFANGKYATGEKFADLIDSMKVVQLPVVDPQALGTSLSFIDSISQDADGKITATKKTLDLANAHELNPFKGWWKTGDTLPTDGFDGAYLYFKDTSEQTGLTTIYRWNGTTYADTGTVVDTSNVQTFGSGQAVNATKIKDESGEEVTGDADVLSAEAGKLIADTTMERKSGLNLLDPNTILVGKRMSATTGAVTDVDENSANYIYGITDFIEIPAEGLIINHAYGGNAPSSSSVGSVEIFDETKTVVTFKYPSGYVTGISYALDPTGHSDWKYVRFTLGMANAGTENATSYDNIANDGYAIYKGLTLPTPQYQEYVEYYEMKSNVDIVDALNSDRGDAALSAKQGKILSDRVETNNASIEDLDNRIFGTPTGDYLDEEHSTFPTSNGITSATELRAFLLEFEMLVERDTAYEYGLAVNNGLPSGTSRAYAVSVIRWTAGETPTNNNVEIYALNSSPTHPENGEWILTKNDEQRTKVVLDWTALQTTFGGNSYFSGLGTGVRFNQDVIFGEVQSNSLNGKVDDLDERVSVLEEQEGQGVQSFPSFHLPTKIYCVKGDKNLLFTRGIVQAVNPYLWSMVYGLSGSEIASHSRPTPRYIELLFDTVEQRTLSLKLVGNDGVASTVKQSTIIAKEPQQPQSNINVLCFGSSTTTDGGWASELKRRLCGVDGTPAGNNLSNITFVGRTKGSTYSDVLVEGIGGWSWKKYMEGATILTSYGFVKFSVASGLTLGTDFNIGDVGAYVNTNGGYTSIRIEDYNDGEIICSLRTADNATPAATGALQPKQIVFSAYDNPTVNSIRFSLSANPYINANDIYRYTNVDGGTTDVKVVSFTPDDANSPNGSGKLSCVFVDSSNKKNPSTTATTLVQSNDSQITNIAYTAYQTNIQWTPFRDNGNFGFQSYADKYCNGSIDVVICLLSYLNQVSPTGNIAESVQSMKDFVDQLHNDFPNCKVLISAGIGASPYGGAGKNYGASQTWTDYGILHGEFVFQDGLEDMIADPTYSGYCYMFNSLQEVDMENAFPTATIPVNLRSESTEVVQTNALHPSHDGELMTADSAYRCFVCTVLN